jgi:hypothetical protein
MIRESKALAIAFEENISIVQWNVLMLIEFEFEFFIT